MPEAGLRRALGRVALVFGVLHLLPTAFVWLSAGGPSPVLVPARTWSLFFYAHFVALTATGVGLVAVDAAKTKLFHGGPLIDFVLGVVGFMLLESVAAFGGTGLSPLALLPGLALAAFGLRLGTGRPLLGGGI